MAEGFGNANSLSESPDNVDIESGGKSPQEKSPRSQRSLVLSNSGKSLEQSTKKQYVKQVTGRHNDTELHLAAKKGDLEAVKRILYSIHPENGTQNSSGHNEDVDIEAGFMRSNLVDVVNELEETPLYIASEKGQLEVLKELMKFASPETLVKKNYTGYDVFHIAAKQGHINIVKELLDFQPALSNTSDFLNATPLISAATNGHVEVVYELLAKDNGQLIGIPRNNGKNALHMSARKGYTEIVRALLKKDPQMTRKPDRKGQTALHMAAKGSNCLEVVRELLQVDPAVVMLPDIKGNMPLHVATRKKRFEIVKELLTMPDINVNAMNRMHKTAMDIAEGLPYSDEAQEIKDILIGAGAVRSRELNQPRDELKKTVSEIKHDVHTQLRQAERTNRNVTDIAKEIRKLHREGINNATNSVTVVAVLFATVAFAAIFTVPGGFLTSGEATVANTPLFQVFFISNAVALFTSLAVVVVQITLVRWEPRSQRKVVEVINKLMWLASVCTSLAFISSAYIVVGPNEKWLAIVVTVIGSFIMFSVLGTLTWCVIKFRRHRSLRKKRSSRSWNYPDFSESEFDKAIYAL
eukprot:TRINITY_DN37910_c0_g1_i1.p1 TRINITY_DN37910_c0_g1~~TRINITY_DN37910_c0_g1_i1.p1  ORF type:complete len:581 (-),score=95.10 TRINITY_DN37910_c0_g1_i1:447-2189(-)